MDPVVPFPWWGGFDRLMVQLGMVLFIVFTIGALTIAVTGPRDILKPDTPEDTRLAFYMSGVFAVLAVLAWVLGPWLMIPVFTLIVGVIIGVVGHAIYKSAKFGFGGGKRPGDTEETEDTNE